MESENKRLYTYVDDQKKSFHGIKDKVKFYAAIKCNPGRALKATKLSSMAWKLMTECLHFFMMISPKSTKYMYILSLFYRQRSSSSYELQTYLPQKNILLITWITFAKILWGSGSIFHVLKLWFCNLHGNLFALMLSFSADLAQDCCDSVFVCPNDVWILNFYVFNSTSD